MPTPSPCPAGPTGLEAEYAHTIGGLFTSLTRAKFRVDTFLEPEPLAGATRSTHWAPAMAWMPATLVLRARKEGS